MIFHLYLLPWTSVGFKHTSDFKWNSYRQSITEKKRSIACTSPETNWFHIPVSRSRSSGKWRSHRGWRYQIVTSFNNVKAMRDHGSDEFSALKLLSNRRDVASLLQNSWHRSNNNPWFHSEIVSKNLALGMRLPRGCFPGYNNHNLFHHWINRYLFRIY